MTFGAFGLVAASGVRASAVEQNQSAPGTRDGLRGSSGAKSDTDCFHKLVVSENWPVVFGHVPHPRMINVGVFELIKPVDSDAVASIGVVLSQAFAKALCRRRCVAGYVVVDTWRRRGARCRPRSMFYVASM